MFYRYLKLCIEEVYRKGKDFLGLSIIALYTWRNIVNKVHLRMFRGAGYRLCVPIRLSSIGSG
jgi:hypothetical protein